MTPEMVLLEYRRIRAIESEDKTGKPYEEPIKDSNYEEFQQSLGLERDG